MPLVALHAPPHLKISIAIRLPRVSVTLAARAQSADDVAQDQGCGREFCAGVEGGHGSRYSRSNPQGQGNEELLGGEGTGGCGARGCLEGRACAERGGDHQAGGSLETREGKFGKREECSYGDCIESRQPRWSFGDHCEWRKVSLPPVFQGEEVKDAGWLRVLSQIADG